MFTGSATRLLKLKRRIERRRMGCKFVKKSDDCVWRVSIGLMENAGGCGFGLGVEVLIVRSYRCGRGWRFYGMES